jgi:DNA repair protein RadC
MKPGRKLIELGAEQCHDAELLAILIGSGLPGRKETEPALMLVREERQLSFQW